LNLYGDYISVGRIDVVARPPYPWDDEITALLKPLNEVQWTEKDRWQKRIKKRREKLHHKLDAIKYHIYNFKNFEKMQEEDYKKYLVANTTLNKIMDNPHVKMRDEVTHYSDLEGLTGFFIKKSNGNDRFATIYYPAMPDGERVSKYMDKTWTNICNLIQESAYPLLNAARR
jgi:hypothetical protein